jgi:hypothetical protein
MSAHSGQAGAGTVIVSEKKSNGRYPCAAHTPARIAAELAGRQQWERLQRGETAQVSGEAVAAAGAMLPPAWQHQHTHQSASPGLLLSRCAAAAWSPWGGSCRNTGGGSCLNVGKCWCVAGGQPAKTSLCRGCISVVGVVLLPPSGAPCASACRPSQPRRWRQVACGWWVLLGLGRCNAAHGRHLSAWR